MAEESYYDTSLTPTIYFFTDKENGKVAAIHMYSIFGIFTMDQSIQDWRPASREEEDFSKYINGDYDTYKYEWASEPYDVTDPAWDPKDIQDWYPSVSKTWAKGETVTVEDLKPYAKKLEEIFVDEVTEETFLEEK